MQQTESGDEQAAQKYIHTAGNSIHSLSHRDFAYRKIDHD